MTGVTKNTPKQTITQEVAAVPSSSVKLMKTKKTESTETQAEPVVVAAANVVVEDLIVKTAKEIENLSEAKAFDMVPKLLDTIDHDYFRLGGILSLIQTNGWYMERGHETFRAYVEQACGMAYRKSMYLIQIYNGLVASGVSWDSVKHLGWTKLKELSSILTVENVDEWAAVAEGMTVLQLQEHIKASTAGSEEGSNADTSGNEAAKTTTMTFKVHPDDKQTVREALDKAKHESGTDVDTVALVNICMDFLGGTSKLAKAVTLRELMQKASPEEVLETFGTVFPEVHLEATLTE